MNYFHCFISGEELVRWVWFGWWIFNTAWILTTLPEKSSWPMRPWGLQWLVGCASTANTLRWNRRVSPGGWVTTYVPVSYDVEILTDDYFVLSQYTHLSDGQTGRQTDIPTGTIATAITCSRAVKTKATDIGNIHQSDNVGENATNVDKTQNKDHWPRQHK